MTTYKIIVYGHVQGVFYRSSTKEVADTLHITGWVQNNSDGTVEILASGTEETLTELIKWCYNGPPMAQVKSINKTPQPQTIQYETFEIR